MSGIGITLVGMTDDGDRPSSSATIGGGVAERVHLPGSTRPPVADLRSKTPVDPSVVVEVTLVLRRRGPLPDGLVTGRATISRDQLAAEHGASPADIDLVSGVLSAAGLQVVAVDAGSRRIAAAGPVEAVATLFGTDLVQADAGDGVVRRYRYGDLSLPGALAGVVIAVLGIDERVQARSKLVQAAARDVSYTPPQLGAVYRFPAGTDGSGQTIAIIELGGGFGQSDLDTYFSGLGLATVPTVTAVGVDGASNVAGADPQGADGEVLLDIEVVGALAPAAAVVVYFAPNTDRGFVDAVSEAAQASPTPAAISISWGGPEDSWTAQTRAALDAALADAAALGVTVTVAAGDNGSGDGSTDGTSHADYPASSPHALACGGTSLHASTTTGQVTSEVVWSGDGATGGGVSAYYPLPAWQAGVGVPQRAGAAGAAGGRGVPDVAADADPATGYAVLIDGTATVIGGTSAVAPLWAALATRLVQAGGAPLGLLAPLLYAGATTGAVPAGFRDITVGNNGAYAAGAGWDACTGLGVPDGTALAARLAAGSATS